MLAWAEAALPWVEALATLRSGGKPARVRTVARCGCAGRVAFSMIGDVQGSAIGAQPSITRVKNINHIQQPGC